MELPKKNILFTRSFSHARISYQIFMGLKIEFRNNKINFAVKDRIQKCGDWSRGNGIKRNGKL